MFGVLIAPILISYYLSRRSLWRAYPVTRLRRRGGDGVIHHRSVASCRSRRSGLWQFRPTRRCRPAGACSCHRRLCWRRVARLGFVAISAGCFAVAYSRIPQFAVRGARHRDRDTRCPDLLAEHRPRRAISTVEESVAFIIISATDFAISATHFVRRRLTFGNTSARAAACTTVRPRSCCRSPGLSNPLFEAARSGDEHSVEFLCGVMSRSARRPPNLSGSKCGAARSACIGTAGDRSRRRCGCRCARRDRAQASGTGAEAAHAGSGARVGASKSRFLATMNTNCEHR